MAVGGLVAVPELQSDGPARLLGQKQGFVDIVFLRSGATMTQEGRRLVRYLLLPGTKIEFDGFERNSKAIAGVIADAVPTNNPDGTWTYTVTAEDGEVEHIEETRISNVVSAETPIQQLANVDFHDMQPRFAKAGTPLPPAPWGPESLCAREQLLRYRDDAWQGTSGVVGLSGARVIPLPHQLLVARRVLADRQIRFLLADEVGLGKTIEAGLIMQSLMAMRPSMRVLIIVPGALVSQWFLELFVKFGGRSFVMLDADRIETYAGNPWSEQFVIVSSRAVEALKGKAALQFASASWDMLIVDECHRMQPGGVLFKRVSVLSKKTPHVLLLSATPGRQHADAYLALLHLLQPDAYALDDHKGFEKKLAAFDTVLDMLERSATADADSWPALSKAWRKLLGSDATVVQLLQAVDEEYTDHKREELCAWIREQYQLDHRIIANRRQVLSRLSALSGVRGLDLGKRERTIVSYKADEAEMDVRKALAVYHTALLSHYAADGADIPPRLAHWLLQLELASWTHAQVLERLLAMRSTVLEEPEEFEEYRIRAAPNEDMGQVLRPDFSESESSTHVAISATCHVDADEEGPALLALSTAVDVWRKRKPKRITALLKKIKKFWDEHPQEKILIFVGHGLAVSLLAEMLEDALGSCVETFGSHQDQLEREEATRRFREDDRISILVSDPLGGEGRNFQFVSIVVHFDLPWSIASVEQRIGRVDRLGRDGSVPSWVLVPDNKEAIDSVWVEVLDQGIGVFESSSSGLEFISAEVETRALCAALRGGAAGLREALPALIECVRTEQSERDEREDMLFHRQEEAFAAADDMARKAGKIHAPTRSVCNWMRGMGGQVWRDDDGARAFHMRTRHAEGFQDGVFQRAEALRHQQLAFFAQGHDLIDRLIDDAGQAAWCAATAWRRKLEACQGNGVVERWDGVRVSYECVLDVAPLMKAKMPIECLRRLFSVVAPHRPLAFFRLTDGQREEDAATQSALRPGFDSSMDATLSPRSSREFWMRSMLGGKSDQVLKWQNSVRAVEAFAEQHAKILWEKERNKAVASLSVVLDEGLAVLRGRRDSALDRLGRGHPDADRLMEEYTQEEEQVAALIACVEGARYEIASAAYVVIA